MDISDLKGPGLILFGAVLLFFFILLLGLAAKIPSGIEHRKIFLAIEAVILTAGVALVSFGINIINLSL